MTITLVQSIAQGNSGGGIPSHTATLPSPPTAGNILIIDCGGRSDPNPINVPTGWTSFGYNLFPSNDNYAHRIIGKVSNGTEQSVIFDDATANGAPESAIYSEWSGFGGNLPTADAYGAANYTHDDAPNIPAITPTPGDTVLLIASIWKEGATPNPGPVTLSGYTLLDDTGFAVFGNRQRLTDFYRVVTTASGTYGPLSPSSSFDFDDNNVIHLALSAGSGGPPPDPDPGPEPPPDPVPPQGVLLEIYVSGAGTARWDVAEWDGAVWGSAEWTDVTPEGVKIQASWGSNRAEDGILAKTVADTWAIDFYDPLRLLDPGNPDTPYAADLIPGLPVRFSHRGKVIRYGIAESIGYDYALKTGYMRVTNSISTMANAMVPASSPLPDTLRARARAAIAAAGLSVTVESDPPTGDPDVAPEIDDEVSVWRHITDAALQVLHIPFMDHNDVLKFREYNAPRDRGVVLSAPELVGLQVIIDGQTRYSTVRAFNGVTIDERSITPTPQYGAKVYNERDNLETIDAEDWAVAVLDDRFSSGLRWIPGAVRPLSANSVDTFALIEAAELVAITDSHADPGVSVAAKVLGGQITVTAKVNDEAVWSFVFRTAQTAAVPLVADQDPSEYIVSDQDPSQLVYPG